MSETRWVCCQLGAREHYAVARAMQRRGQLEALVTDAWSPPGSAWTAIPGATGRRLRERYSRDLAEVPVVSATASLLAHEALWRIRGRRGWQLPMARNSWFQRQAASAIASLADSREARVVFAHSYSALAILREARRRKCRTVLGQIDPGESHFRLVADLAARRPEFGAAPVLPPPEYFAAWREECALADIIVVNSEWSRDMLTRAGMASAKIRIIPLPYEPDDRADSFTRQYPESFSAVRPLNALSVGSVTAAKGIPELLEAMLAVSDLPIRLDVVGEIAVSVPERYRTHAAIHWHGALTRREVMARYQAADVLVFPSHSDGFGMAQVEAQGWNLPIIASRSCGHVVDDGRNGATLTDVSADAIAASLRSVVADPSILAQWSAQATRAHGLDAFGAALSGLFG